jgi:hypothetical protein
LQKSFNVFLLLLVLVLVLVLVLLPPACRIASLRGRGRGRGRGEDVRRLSQEPAPFHESTLPPSKVDRQNAAPNAR